MTKYCIKLISEVYFEFDYEGVLKDSCIPENYPEEIKALIMEEAKKLSDKNFYVGYCNERRGPGSWGNSSEELKEEEKMVLGNLYDHSIWGMLPIKMREALAPQFIYFRGFRDFYALTKKLSPEEEKEVLTHMEWIECLPHLLAIIEYLKENKLILPFNEEITDEELNKLSVKPYDFVEGYKRALAREMEQIQHIQGEVSPIFSHWIATMKEYIKEAEEAANKPTETSVEKTGENNE